jgi:hypothetical protein
MCSTRLLILQRNRSGVKAHRRFDTADGRGEAFLVNRYFRVHEPVVGMLRQPGTMSLDRAEEGDWPQKKRPGFVRITGRSEQPSPRTAHPQDTKKPAEEEFHDRGGGMARNSHLLM